MPYAQHPLAIDPVRTNILQIPQFYNEIKSLQSHADGLKGEIEMRKRELAELVQKESARKAEIISNVAPRPAGGSVRTSDVYHVVDLPSRFDDPESWTHNVKSQNPLYTTTSNDYGLLRPSIHEMPMIFKGQSSKFSEHLNQAGPYRDYSLNA